MTSRGRDFQGAFGAFLTFDITQVMLAGALRDFARCGRGQRGLAGIMPHHRTEAGGRDHLRIADPSRFGTRGSGAQQATPVFRRSHRRRQRADHGDQAPVQRQFAQGDGALDDIIRQDIDRPQQGQRDRQVEMAAFFGQVGRAEVDRDPFRGKRDMHRGQGGAHTVARLADRLVG